MECQDLQKLNLWYAAVNSHSPRYEKNWNVGPWPLRIEATRRGVQPQPSSAIINRSNSTRCSAAT